MTLQIRILDVADEIQINSVAVRQHTAVIGGGSLNAEYEDRRHYAGELEQKNDQLKDKLDKQGTVEGVKDAAGDELGMVDKDATIVPVQ